MLVTVKFSKVMLDKLPENFLNTPKPPDEVVIVRFLMTKPLPLSVPLKSNGVHSIPAISISETKEYTPLGFCAMPTNDLASYTYMLFGSSSTKYAVRFTLFALSHGASPEPLASVITLPLSCQPINVYPGLVGTGKR